MNREVVIKLFKKVARILEDDKQYEWLADEVKDYLNEMYVDEELGVKPKQEPEAWILKETGSGYKTQVAWKPSALKKGWIAIPLYAGSPTCEPLSDEQLLDERVRQIMIDSTCEPLSDEQKSAEAKLEQSLKDSIDEERIRQIMIDCISYD